MTSASADPFPRWTTGRFAPPMSRVGVGLIVAVVLVASPVSMAAASAAQPGSAAAATLSVKPDKGLVGNRILNIVGMSWSSASDVAVDICAGNPQPSGGPCLLIGTPQPSRHGSWAFKYEPLVGQPPAVCMSACYTEAAQDSTVVDAALVERSPSLTITARKGDCCYIGQPTSVKGSNFPVDDPVHIEVCSTANGCDSSTNAQAVASRNGAVKFTGFNMDITICSTGGGACYLLATDATYGNGPIYVTQYFPVYCGPIACPSLASRQERRSRTFDHPARTS
jgi:hypothetical protein